MNRPPTDIWVLLWVIAFAVAVSLLIALGWIVRAWEGM